MAVTGYDLNLDDEQRAERDRGPSPYPLTDAEDEDEYASYSRALWDEQEGSLEFLHRVWTQNILFLAGYQWWRFDERKGVWGPETAPDWKEHPVSNLCLPFFKTFLAKVTKNKPAWTAISASTDPEDIHSAKLADEALEAKWLELRMSRVLRRALAWVIPTGNAFLAPYWNERTGVLRPLTTPVQAAVFDELGVRVGLEEVDCPCDENGDPHMTQGPTGEMIFDLEREPMYEDVGEVGCKVYSPFQVRVDPGAECDDDVTWVIIGEIVPVRDIVRENPDAEGRVHAEDVGVLDQYDRMIAGLGNFGGPDTQVLSSGHSRDEDIPKALKLHYYEKQSERHPHGRYWCTVGDVCLSDPGPLPDGVWPVVIHLTDVEVPGRYHAMATMEAVVGLNREYNELNAMIKEHHNLLLRGKWLVPVGANIKKGSITNQPGEVIQHTPGLKPEQADIKPLPNVVYEERNRVMADFERISGVQSISMGKPPPGVTSGTAFLTLQEADDSDLGPFLAMLEESVAEIAGLFLQLMQQRYDEERLIYISGENRRYQAKAFKGADLSGVVDIRPQSDSAFPWSRTARQSMLIDLLRSVPGMFMDEETGVLDRARVARLLPVAGLESLSSMEDIDVNEALREEDDFSTILGEPGDMVPQVMPWQNHEVHYREHTRMLKSAEFDRWPDPAKQAFLAHWQQTQQARQMARVEKVMQAAATQQMAMGEAPAEGAGEGSSEEA